MIVYYTPDFSGGRDESHRLLADAITEYTGDRQRADMLAGSIYTGRNGKPYIDGFDFFSISHTENVWAVLFCERECGLDIQLAKKCKASSIAERFYHPDDAAALAAIRSEDEQKGYDGFFRLWARREALVKAAGGSIAGSDIPSVLEDRVVYEGASYGIRDIAIPDMPGLYAALAVRGGEADGEIGFKKMADKKDKQKKTAFEAACSYLSNRMHTTAEVRKHLESREYGEEEITEAVNELIGLRYLDDYLYAARYYEYNREKKRGVKRAERELMEKGIDHETVRNAKEDFLYEQGVDEYSDALEIARGEVFTKKDVYGDAVIVKELDDRLRARIARKLESKGFSRSDIYRVLDTLRREANADD